MPRTSNNIIAINQLSATLKTLEVGYQGRVSKDLSDQYMVALDHLYERCSTWADEFMPTARDEYEGLIAGDIDNSEIPLTRATSLAYNATVIRLFAGCYYKWTKDDADWIPLAEFIRCASLEPGSGHGALLVDAGLVAEGGITPFARAQLPAHRFQQGHRDVYYFTLDLATLDGLLPQRIDDTVVREANRRLTPSHARDIQQYLESRPDWLLGALLLGISPDALVFEPYQDPDGNEYSPNFGELRIITHRANTMRIFDGQHRRRAIHDTLDRLGNTEGKIDKLVELQGSSVPIVLYAEDDIGALRQMFTDASKTKHIEANVVTRFDKRDPFNVAAMQLVDESHLFRGRVELNATTVARGSQALISVNQLSQALRVMTVGYGSRISRVQNDLYMQDFDKLYESCLAWSDQFMPSTRWEFEGLLSGDIKNEDIPAYRAETLAYNTTFMRILAGCYHDWMEAKEDWTPLTKYLKCARLETEGGHGNLLVDAGAMLPGDSSPSGRRQEVDGAIKYIVQQATEAAD